ncbi:MAG: hypothetical protein N3A01_06305, partial [Bacteroidales bacterium]|nr:hypothetical protein [Bacteroidales bacterium]
VKSVVESAENLIKELNNNYELIKQLNKETSNYIIDFTKEKILEIKSDVNDFFNQTNTDLNNNYKKFTESTIKQLKEIESNIQLTSKNIENQITQTTNQTKNDIDNFIKENKETILQLKNETLKILNSLYETQVETKKILNELYNLNLPQNIEQINTNLTNLKQNYAKLMDDFQTYKTKYLTNNKLMFILIILLIAFQLFVFLYNTIKL